MSGVIKFSPSDRHRWANCPASLKLTKDLPSKPPGKSAIEGTHAHTLLEQCIILGLINAHELKGVEMVDHEGKFKVTDKMANLVNVAIDFIKATPHDSLFAERKVNCDWFLPDHLKGKMNGKIDITLISDGGKTVHIADFKAGMGVVSADENLQMEEYLLGVSNEYPNAEKFVLHIIQPAIGVLGKPVVSSYEVLAVTIPDRIIRIIEQAEATLVDDPPVVPGDSQCSHCGINATCKARVDQTMQKTELMFSQSSIVEQVVDKDMTTIDDKKLAELMDALPAMKQMIKAVEEEVTRRAGTKEGFPGYKLIKGRGSRSWIQDEEKMVGVFARMGIPKKALYKQEFVSPAGAEKLTFEKAGKSVGLSKEQILKLNENYIVTTEGKPQLVPSSDPRPSINDVQVAKIESMFEPTTTDGLPDWMK